MFTNFTVRNVNKAFVYMTDWTCALVFLSRKFFSTNVKFNITNAIQIKLISNKVWPGQVTFEIEILLNIV